MRILITGASGSGTTTLGRALAERLGSAYFDIDDYYWLPTQPPYTHKRDPQARLTLLLEALRGVPTARGAVLGGSVMDWGVALQDSFTLIVFLTLPAELRVARLHQREIEKLGRADPEFLASAAQYDEGRLDGRSRTISRRPSRFLSSDRTRRNPAENCR